MISFVDSNNKTKHSQNRSPNRKICQEQNYQREGSLALVHTIPFSDPTVTQIKKKVSDANQHFCELKQCQINKLNDQTSLALDQSYLEVTANVS